MNELRVLRRAASSETDLTVQPSLNRLPDEAGRVAAVKLIDGDNSRWRRDVDLGQPLSADDIDTNEQQPARLELRLERLANLAFGRRQLCRFRSAAGGEVGADFACPRAAVDCTREFAIDEDDPFISLGDF